MPVPPPPPPDPSRGRRIVRWVLATLGTQGVVMALNLATGILSARVMGPDLKGIYNAVILWPGVFFSLTSMGLSAAFTSMYARAPGPERRRIFAVAAAMALLWGTVGAVLCTVFAPRLLAHLGPQVRVWVLIGSWVPVPTNATYVCSALLSVEERFGWLNWINASRAVTVALGLVALALWHQLNPYTQLTLVWATAFLSSLPGMIMATRAALRLPRGRAGPAWTRLSAQLTALGVRFYAINLASTFNAQLDSMLSTIWLSATQIGLYAVASSGVSVVAAISGAFATVFFPMAAADDAATIARRTSTALRRALLVFLAVELVLVLLARPVLALMYGTRYLGAWTAVLALAPEAVFTSCIGVLYSGCYAAREFVVPAVGEVVGAASGFGLLLLFIPRWGIAGAGAAGSLSYGLDLLTVTVLWARRQGVPVRDLVPRRADAQAVADLSLRQARELARRGLRLGRLAPPAA
jgi:O-antigen/teichoic acid export membrane protein